jgi:hypothetical protein
MLRRFAGVSEARARSRNPECYVRGISEARAFADVAQLVEHSLGKGEVTSSILVIGSRWKWLKRGFSC